MCSRKRFLSKVWLVIPLLSLALVAVACGGAAPPTPVPAPKAAAPPAVPAAPVTAPTVAPTLAAAPKAAPAPTPVPAPAVKVNPGKLTIMAGSLANERFDYAFGAQGYGGTIYGRIVHGFLISDNERKEMVPGIASQWGLSADGLTWTFTIRKGAKFHNGSEVTPEDVVWSLQHLIGPQAIEYVLSTTATSVARRIDRIELGGPDKVSVTSKKPITELAVLISEVGTSWYPIIPKRAKVHDTEEETAYDNNPIGAGFMRLEKRVPAYVMKFERFDGFYYQPKNGFPEDKRVNFQSLDLFLVPEEATRVAAIRAGEADIVPASLPTKKQVEAGGGRLVFGQEGVYVEAYLIGCWESKFPCYDKRVRQALQYAMDKELMRDRLYGGPQVFQVKGWFAVSPSTIGYTPAVDPFPFDPNKARQLLGDAGYPGGKGFGKLIVNTHPSSSMPFQVEAAQLAAEFWRRELGLDVEVKVGDSVGVETKEKAGELKGQIYWRENETRIDATSIVASRYGDPENVRRVHQDPELSRTVQATVQLVDLNKRAEASTKLFPQLRDEAYNFSVGYANIPWGVGPRVLTWRPYPLSQWPSALHTITLK